MRGETAGGAPGRHPPPAPRTPGHARGAPGRPALSRGCQWGLRSDPENVFTSPPDLTSVAKRRSSCTDVAADPRPTTRDPRPMTHDPRFAPLRALGPRSRLARPARRASRPRRLLRAPSGKRPKVRGAITVVPAVRTRGPLTLRVLFRRRFREPRTWRPWCRPPIPAPPPRHVRPWKPSRVRTAAR